MEIDKEIAQQIYNKILESNNILIISHRGPDPDTLGSNLAIRHILEKKSKKVTSACVDPIPPNYNFLPGLDSFVTEFNFNDFDLIITVDAGSIGQVAFGNKYPEILEGKIPFINIDHHPSNDRYGTINLVVDTAASTTLMIYFLLESWQEEITPAIATALLYGLYYDTGSFMHSNTCDVVYDVAAKLLQKGAEQDLIVRHLFKTHTIPQMQLWGKALNNAYFTPQNVIVSGVNQQDFLECNASGNDLSGVIDYLSSAKGAHFATLINNDTEGNIKGSFRTRREDINVSEIAQSFGGGGHKKASGFSIKGNLSKQTRWSIKSDHILAKEILKPKQSGI